MVECLEHNQLGSNLVLCGIEIKRVLQKPGHERETSGSTLAISDRGKQLHLFFEAVAEHVSTIIKTRCSLRYPNWDTPTSLN